MWSAIRKMESLSLHSGPVSFNYKCSLCSQNIFHCLLVIRSEFPTGIKYEIPALWKGNISFCSLIKYMYKRSATWWNNVVLFSHHSLHIYFLYPAICLYLHPSSFNWNLLPLSSVHILFNLQYCVPQHARNHLNVLLCHFSTITLLEKKEEGMFYWHWSNSSMWNQTGGASIHFGKFKKKTFTCRLWCLCDHFLSETKQIFIQALTFFAPIQSSNNKTASRKKNIWG